MCFALLSCSQLDTHTHKCKYKDKYSLVQWKFGTQWYTVVHLVHLVESGSPSGTLGTLGTLGTRSGGLVHTVVHRVVHLVHSGEWEWQIRDLTAAAAPWDLGGHRTTCFFSSQMTILKLNFLSIDVPELGLLRNGSIGNVYRKGLKCPQPSAGILETRFLSARIIIWMHQQMHL